MKSIFKKIAGVALVAALALGMAGCSIETESNNSSLLMAAALLSSSRNNAGNLTQDQLVSNLDEASKESVFEAVLAGKNAEALLAKLSDEKKAEIFGELLTDDKKNEIYNEKLTDAEKAKIFNQILTDKRTANTFLALLTEAEKQSVYNVKLTDAEKARIFNEIFAGKRTDGKVVELLNDEEKSAVFDTLLAIRTSKDFIVGILTKEGNETLYNEVKAYIVERFTQAELIALLNAETKTGIYEEILAGKNAEALLGKLSDEQKAALFDKMLTAEKKNAAFEEILAAKRAEGKVAELLTEAEKSSVFDTLLATRTSKDFIVGILTKEGNETLYNEVKEYFAGKFTKEELASLLAATDTTAPAAVQTLTAISKHTGIELIWTDPSDEDLWGFVIGYYEAPASRALAFDSTKHEFVVGKSQNADKSNKAFVGNLTDKESYIFHIKSIDENFNVSEAKEIKAIWEAVPEGFVKVEGGTVTGAAYTDNYKGVFPAGRNVTLSSFYMGEYEVTQAEYKSVMEGQKVTVNGTEYTLADSPSYCVQGSEEFKIDADKDHANYPVENVTWFDAVYYCNALSTKEGLQPCYTITVTTVSSSCHITAATVEYDKTKNGYRLPTEAEWEYAARGGDPTAADWNYTFSGANKADGTLYNYSKNAGLDSVGWYCFNNISGTTVDSSATDSADGCGTHEVGKKAANRLGIHDMSGNVWEWCYDWYGSTSSETVTDPAGASSGDCRVIRGGSWYIGASSASVSYRIYYSPDDLDYNHGFRVVRNAN